MFVGFVVSSLLLVEHCIKPDQFGLCLSGDESSHAECQSRLKVRIGDSMLLNGIGSSVTLDKHDLAAL